MTVRRVRVGDVLHLARRAVAVTPLGEYREIGVRSFGRGLFHKESVSGAELGSKRVFEIHDGDLVVSNVFAWEGAVAVATEAESGMIGSHRFMTWVPDQDRVDARYAYYYFTSSHGTADLVRASPGSAGRNKTLGISAFESLTIPLPGLDEQRAIADRLDRVVVVAGAVDSDLAAVAALCSRAESEAIAQVLDQDRGVPLGDLADVNPRPARDVPESIHFIPMADVDDVTGSVVGTQLVERSSLKSGYKQMLPGDVIFARITPCMQNGKCAIFTGDVAGVGYGSTEFHVLRVHDQAIRKPLHTLLRSDWFRSAAALHFTGTAGQQRVPADFLREVVVPDLRSAGSRQAVGKLRHWDDVRRSAKALAERRSDLRSALPQAARNQVFAALP